MKPELKRNFYDSEYTYTGKLRKNIYINKGTFCGDNSAKLQALKDFTADKKTRKKQEKIQPYKRCLRGFRGYIEKEKQLEREEIKDYVFQIIYFIL